MTLGKPRLNATPIDVKGGKNFIHRLRERIRKRPYFLVKEFAQSTLDVAVRFIQSDLYDSTLSRPLINAANEYSLARSYFYQTFVVTDRNTMANNFHIESRRALEYCLREFADPRPIKSATAIDLVGHHLRHPHYYGRDLQRELLMMDRRSCLTWFHFAQLGRLAFHGPTDPRKPQLVTWYDQYEGPNAPLSNCYDRELEATRQHWMKICDDICEVAKNAIRAGHSPIQLGQVVNLRLGLRPRGRPRKRTIDVDAQVTVPDIPIH